MTLTELSKKYEHYETPEWAVDEILKHEILTRRVFDPCVGTGVLAAAAMRAGYDVFCNDIHDWGYVGDCFDLDFLSGEAAHHFKGLINNSTVLVNPPFSLACDFVKRALELGARKVVCFQRNSWRESGERREFWKEYPLARKYLCASRATCFRHDIPKDEQGNRYDPVTGRRLSNTPTAHAWFVWERGQGQSNPPEYLLYKDAS